MSERKKYPQPSEPSGNIIYSNEDVNTEEEDG